MSIKSKRLISETNRANDNNCYCSEYTAYQIGHYVIGINEVRYIKMMNPYSHESPRPMITLLL
jgi:hypothetical protein